MKLVISSRHGGTMAERRAYNVDKCLIDVMEGKLRNLVARKVVQVRGGLIIV